MWRGTILEISWVLAQRALRCSKWECQQDTAKVQREGPGRCFSANILAFPINVIYSFWFMQVLQEWWSIVCWALGQVLAAFHCHQDTTLGYFGDIYRCGRWNAKISKMLGGSLWQTQFRDASKNGLRETTLSLPFTRGCSCEGSGPWLFMTTKQSLVELWCRVSISNVPLAEHMVTWSCHLVQSKSCFGKLAAGPYEYFSRQ